MKEKIIGILSIILVILVCVLIAISLKYAVNKEKKDNSNESIEELIPDELKSDEEKEPLQIETTIESDDEEEWLEALQTKNFEKLKEIADKDETNTDFAFIVGEMYLQGTETFPNVYDASTYIKAAAVGGNKNAFLIYSEMCFMGEGEISQDYEEAAKYAYCIKDENEAASNMLGVIAEYKLCDENIDASDIIITNTTYQNAELKEAITKLSDELLENQSYEKYSDELVNIQNMNKEMANQVAIFGKNNWLFWKHPNDGDSFHDYIGDNAYSETEMAQIAKNLLEQKSKVEAKGAKFVLLVIPNKETVYYEYMPSYIQRVDSVTRMDKLVDYLCKNTDIDVIYMRDDFEKMKKDVDLYYKTDTHTNMKGSFVCVSKLMKNLYSKELNVNETSFQVHMRDFCGDIGTAINRGDRYSIDSVYFLAAEDVRHEDKVDDSMVLIGDSFSEFLNIELQYYFTGGVDHVMVRDYGYNYYNALNSRIDNLNCDIVVWQVAERFADRLKK